MKKIVVGLFMVVFCAAALFADTNGAVKASASASASVTLTAKPAPAAQEPQALPAGNVDEVVKVLREHYVDREKLDTKTLDAATLAGILNLLGRGATIVTPETPTTNAPAESTMSLTNVTELSGATGPLGRAEIIEPNIGYIRVYDVSETTVPAFDAELKKFAESKCDGYVLDLRFADGTNFAAAAEMTGRFFNEERDLFVLKSAGKGDEVFRAHPTDETDKLADAPIVLLVNSQTRGAAEALVGALRGQDRGIVIGSLTAGSAASTQDIPLSDGRALRVATGKITLKVADPKSLANPDIFPHGIAPDIFVPLDLSVEQDVVLHASTNTTLTVSLQPRTQKKRMTEADLVKVFKGEALDKTPTEESDEETTDEGGEGGEVQKVRDVVLQRAVDVLKGIRVLLTWQ